MGSPQFSHHGVNTLYSVAHLFPKRARCGVYNLRFHNDERYVGQAQNIVTRFSAHRRRWDDIEYLDFSPCPKPELRELEVEMIDNQIRLGKVLRNITNALGPVGDSDLDPLITPDEQYAWLNSDEVLPDVTERIHDTQHRAETRPKFRALAKTPPGRMTILFMHMYVFANCSSPAPPDRTNVLGTLVPADNQPQETVCDSLDQQDGDRVPESGFRRGKRGEGPLGGCINVSASAVAANYGEDAVAKNFPALSVDPAPYEAAGGDALSFRGELGPLLRGTDGAVVHRCSQATEHDAHANRSDVPVEMALLRLCHWVLREDLSEEGSGSELSRTVWRQSRAHEIGSGHSSADDSCRRTERCGFCCPNLALPRVINGEESLLEGLYESLITRALEQRLAGVSALAVRAALRS